MPSRPCSFGFEADAKLAQMADHWVSERYDEALAEACELYLSVKDDGDSRLRDVAIEFVRQSVAGLEDGSERRGRKTAPCSFCGTVTLDVRCGIRSSVFICSGCVEKLHDLAPEQSTTSVTRRL